MMRIGSLLMTALSLVSASPGCSARSHWYNSHAPLPLTSILLNIGKVAS